MREININNIANSVKQGKVSFLVGAGISYNSGIPLVGNINDDLKIVDGIETYILDRLGFSSKEISRFLQIPFETFFEVLINNNINQKEFSRIFNAEPSLFHSFLAELSRKFPINIGTTNFDNCIEKAFQERGFSYKIITKENYELCDRNIWKFHGSIDNLDNLGITIKNISNKRNFNERIELITQFISQSDYIIVCGYSCSDIFDVTPAFANYKFKNKKNIIYISHKRSEIPINISETGTEYTRIRNMFDGYNLSIIEYNTDKFVYDVMGHLNINWLEVKNIHFKWKDIIDICINNFDQFRKNKTVANLYYQIEDFQKSIEYLEVALKCASDIDQELACKRSIGWTYCRLNDVKNALLYLEPLLRRDDVKFLMNQFPEHYANIYSHLGVCYIINKEYKSAKECFDMSIYIAEKYQLIWVLGQALINTGEFYRIQGEYDEAIKYTSKALEILEENGYLEYVGICYANLSEISAKQNKISQSIKYMKLAINIAKDLGNTTTFIKRKNTLDKIYEQSISQ